MRACVWKEGGVEEAKFLLQSSPGLSPFFFERPLVDVCRTRLVRFELLCAITIWPLIGLLNNTSLILCSIMAILSFNNFASQICATSSLSTL